MSTFDFGLGFQKKTLALMIRDMDFLKRFFSIVKPSYFERVEDATICAICLEYFKSYNKKPTPEAVLELLFEMEGERLSPSERETYNSLLNDLKFLDIDDRDYVADRIAEFVRMQEMQLAVIDSAEILQRREKDYQAKILKRIDRAYKVLDGMEDIGTVYFRDLQARLYEEKDEFIDNRVPTLIRGLDHFTHGLGSGEMGIIMAPPNRGKSMMLIALGKAAIFLGKTVVHYTLEMSELKVSSRYDSCFTGKTKEEISSSKEESIGTIRDIGKKFSGQLIVKQYPTKTASPMTIKSHLSMLESQGIRPDLIIVDYGDILKPVRQRGDTYSEQGEVFEMLRGIASELGIPLWSATQTGRAATSKRVISMEDVADSYNKCRIADIIITMCQTDDEREQGVLRLFLAKNRDNKAFQTVTTTFDWAKVSLREKIQDTAGDSSVQLAESAE